MKTQMQAQIIDMKQFSLPSDRTGRITQIHKPVPRKRGNINFDIYDYEYIFNDEKTKELIRTGQTIGCFYIESPGMRSLLQRLECDTFEMLVATSSIIRPGVAESGMMQQFIERHKDPRKREYLLPEMGELLSETYGVMVYQEDVIKVAHHICGLSLEESDLLRRAMSGKMRSKEAMRRLVENFFYTARAKGLKDEIIRELWRQISSFAGYAFCKAHSASFALLSFQVAYLKANYPAEFMASVLTNQGGYYSAAVYIQEAKRLGLNVLLPCVNKGEYEYTGSGKELRVGLMAIKKLSFKTCLKIISERKKNGEYDSLLEFINRTGIKQKECELLITSGALDSLNLTRSTLFRLNESYFRNKTDLADTLFDNVEEYMIKECNMKAKQYHIEDICRDELELLGFMVTKHPLEFVPEREQKGVVQAKDMKKYNNRYVKMVGWYMTSKRIKTKKEQIMKFLSLEDLSGTFEAVLFPDTYSKYAQQTLYSGAFLVEGKINIEGGNNIIVSKLQPLSLSKLRSVDAWDSAENTYKGDIEPFSDSEIDIAASLNKKIVHRLFSKGA